MKLKFLVIFAIFTNIIFSQEIESTYIFKKEQKKRIFVYYEFDSLVLYKNGNFHQIYSYFYHEIKYKEIKGDWKIENGILLLNVNKETSSTKDSIWKESFAKYRYKIKGKKLLPIVTIITKINEGKTINYYFLPNKKLKILKKRNLKSKI